MLKTENCPWQERMDRVYDRWQEHGRGLQARLEAGEIDITEYRRRSWSKRDILRTEISEADRVAVIFGNLNYQIENGGVIQWVDNGYASAAIEWLPDILPATGPVGEKIWELLRPFLEDYMDESGEISQYEDDDSEWREAFEVSDRISNEFYELQDAWHPEVYAYLAGL